MTIRDLVNSNIHVRGTVIIRLRDNDGRIVGERLTTLPLLRMEYENRPDGISLEIKGMMVDKWGRIVFEVE